MREEKIARGVTGTLIVLPLAFALAYMTCGYDAARWTMFYGLACTVVGLAAGWVLGRRHALLQILCTVLPAAALALAVPAAALGAWYIRYILMAIGVLLAVLSERRFVTTSGSMLRSGILLVPFATIVASGAFIWFAQSSGSRNAAQIWGMLVIVGSIWFIAVIFLMNRLSLRQAARAGSHSDVPVGARRSGSAGVVIFLVCSFLLASIGTIVQAIGTFFQMLGRWILQIFLFIASLFPQNGPPKPMDSSAPQQVLPADNTTQSPLMQLITNIIIVLVLLAVLAAIIYGLSKLFPKLWKKLQERFRSLFATWKEDEADYRDRTESLMSLKQAMADAGAGLRKLARRFRRRPRIADFDTNADKARFLFREYVHGLVSSGHEPPPGATATDIAKPVPALAKVYNRARYGEEEPLNSEIEKARESVKI
jgi:hypothetical protein